VIKNEQCDMRTFQCRCGNRLFFENTQCVACGSELGWCPACRQITALLMDESGYRCANAECGVALQKCSNYADHHVCNRCVIRSEADGAALPAQLCDYCRFNDTIPDLSVPENHERWRRLEAAKRRLLYALDHLQLPYGTEADGFVPPLSFDFKADVKADRRWGWTKGQEERVFTGHVEGKITINIREADAVEREKARVNFNEAHRTIIGHFRHEIGHYYWLVLVKDRCEDEIRRVFGDHSQSYSEAQERYYREGPPVGWQQHFVSSYASMHPWEDFAESFATYLDMASVLDTARNMGLQPAVDPLAATLDEMVSRYQQLGFIFNELNRAMGLLDLVPEVFVAPTVEKLRFVHELVVEARQARHIAAGLTG
jgi:hypothetical protein